jgi:glutamine phosphoribosylpyrophosphate amidotransferase
VAALNLAQKLQLPYREGFVKNRYVGRTFIMPGQEMRWASHETPREADSDETWRRKKNVRRKLNAMALEFVDKNVLLVDGRILHLLLNRRLNAAPLQILSFAGPLRKKLFRWQKTSVPRKSL